MPDITPIVRPQSAAQLITDAINAAHARGLTVSTAPDLGVVATSTHAPAWEVDPRAAAISVLGAVLLAHQPPVVDVDHALAYVFRTRPEFCEGIEDGVKGVRDVAHEDRLYRDGLFLGAQVRELIQRRQGVPIAREAD